MGVPNRVASYLALRAATPKASTQRATEKGGEKLFVCRAPGQVLQTNGTNILSIAFPLPFSVDSVLTLLPFTRGSAQDFELAYAIKKVALGPHIIPRWGWDDAKQRATMHEKWAAKTFFRIEVDGQTVGTISLDPDGDGMEIGEFYILPEHQKRGLGAQVLDGVLAQAGEKPVRLRVLKWNPAFALYKRHGFAVVGESDIHYFMERAAAR